MTVPATTTATQSTAPDRHATHVVRTKRARRSTSTRSRARSATTTGVAAATDEDGALPAGRPPGGHAEPARELASSVFSSRPRRAEARPRSQCRRW